MIYLELLFVLLLTLLNGLLALSELAVVSSRRGRLEYLANLGHPGARVAQQLLDDPSRFLSSVQIGITLVGILAGAISGATIAARLGAWLNSFPMLAPYGASLGIGLVVVGITYLSLVLGELVPKRIALTNPERVAAAVARPMRMVSRIGAPAVWLLGISTEAILKLMGLSGVRDSTVTEEEVKSLIDEGTTAGVFVPAERDMIEGVLRMADRAVKAIMTPRSEIIWIDVNADRAALLKIFEDGRCSRLLVCDGSIDHAIGVVHTKDLLPVALRGETPSLKSLMAPPLIVPERTSTLKLLDQFQRQKVHMAVLIDEYGTTRGLVTPTDILEAIAGDLPEHGEEEEELVVRREDGSWLIDGMLRIDEFEQLTGLRGLNEARDFNTMAGFVLDRIGHLPKAGERFSYGQAQFEVIDMDRRRIDKILYVPAPPLADDDSG